MNPLFFPVVFLVCLPPPVVVFSFSPSETLPRSPVDIYILGEVVVYYTHNQS